MNRHRRLDMLTERLQTRHGEIGPLTLFLVEADAEHPVDTRVLWGGHAPEFAYDPVLGAPARPPGGHHKIILEAGMEVCRGVAMSRLRLKRIEQAVTNVTSKTAELPRHGR
jgi:hypothetical protein